VDVEMRHVLIGVAAVIGEDSIARLGHPMRAGNAADGAGERDDLGV
jgi:hypothetical protein